MDLSVHNQRAFDPIADPMNKQPRQTLDWLTPYQGFKQFKYAIEQRLDASRDDPLSME